MMWFIHFHRLFEIRMVIIQLLCDEMVINSSHIDGISVIFSPSGHNDGSPINQIHHHGNGFLMMWFNSLSSFPFEIRMVITYSLYDESIKKIHYYQWNFAGNIPILGIMQNYG